MPEKFCIPPFLETSFARARRCRRVQRHRFTYRRGRETALPNAVRELEYSSRIEMPPTSKTGFEVEILLATFNGELFLEQQLDSLFSQTCQDFSVAVRDDLSTDGTVSILERYAEKYPLRFSYAVNRERLGAAANFAALLLDSTAPYVMCCDQDDVWLSEKVALTVGKLRSAERELGRQVPVLAYSDAVLVDQNLQVISPSYWKRCRIRPRGAHLRNLLAQNLVTGCTMACNRALLERGLPVPARDVVMHDYWLALVAVAFGVMTPIHQSTILYRQHDKNTIGIGRRAMTSAQRIRRLVDDPRLRVELLAAIRQAQAFSARFSAELSNTQKLQLAVFQELGGRGYISRRWIMLRHGLLRTGFLNAVGYLLRI